jgi:energy-coupling factor transporter ATP-binding protein EcfA2
MITRIFADNFACFSGFAFEPAQINLLVGDNGSGKSSLLYLVSNLRLLAMRTDALTTALLPATRTRWETRPEQRLGITLADVAGGTFEWAVSLVVNPTSRSVEIASETIRKDEVIIAERTGGTFSVRGKDLPIPYQLDGSLLALRLDDADLHALHAAMEDIMLLKLDLSAIEATTGKASPSLRFDGGNFPSNYRHMRETSFESVTRLHDALREVLGGFRSIELVDVGDDVRVLVVKFLSGIGKPDFDLAFRDLSEGQRALIVYYHLLTTFSLTKRTLLIDEPDNYLALREIQPWLQALTRAVEDHGTQALVASHNPEVIDYLAADSAWLFERDGAGPSRVRRVEVDRDSGLKASEQLARGWTNGA